MATSYHYEALRRQRIIDRAAEARRRVEESQQESKEEILAEKNKRSKRKRHRKTHKTSSDNHHKMECSFPGMSKRHTSCVKVESLATPEVLVKSQEKPKSFPVKDSIHSVPTTPHDSEVTLISRHSSNNQSRESTAASENTTMASSTKSRQSSASISMTSYFSTPSTAQLKAEAIRKDLERQERILHDSNLVLGSIDVEEETKLQQAERGI